MPALLKMTQCFFPNLISSPFMIGLHGVFYLSAAMCLVGALASFLRGKRFVNQQVTSGTRENVPVAQVESSATTGD